jgi:phosphoribosylamine--glycine ligase
MNILLLGSGGREHALAEALSRSRHTQQLFIAPGNAGTAQCGHNITIKPTDFEAVRQVVLDHHIDLVVVGPEEPLVLGIVDFFINDTALQRVQIIGPSKEAARLEGSKDFAKAFMQRHEIPTASYKSFDAANWKLALDYIEDHPLPVVIKADGLAAGKGVLICETREQARAAVQTILCDQTFGHAGNTIVIEQFLNGIEISVFVLTNGKGYMLLPEAKDYKRIGEGDIGLNTGGMGAVSPVPFFDNTLRQKITERIIEPTIRGIAEEAMHYVGFVFFGLMICDGEPYVIEYNCRMGDPETEVVIPRMEEDIVELFTRLNSPEAFRITIQTTPLAAVTTMAVSQGYPGSYCVGKAISGLIPMETPGFIFHAGTRFESDNQVVTAGGRVLAVTALAASIPAAAEAARKILQHIHFEGMYFRRDIGYEFGASGIR